MIVDNRLEIDGLALEGMLPAECEQAVRQFGSGQGRGERVFDQLHLRRARRRCVLQQIEIADDDQEEIIEIVRDPAGQLADCFELLRLNQSLFHRAALHHGLLERLRLFSQGRLRSSQ